MPQNRDRFRSACTLALFAGIAAIGGGYETPSISAQSPAGGPPQFLTWQLMAQPEESLAAPFERVMTRRPVMRPRVQRPGQVRGDLGLLSDADAAVDVSAPVTLLQSFTGLTLTETGSLPPDPSGAAGPSQFILAANGRIRSFSKATGAPDGVLNLATNTFFSPVRNGAVTFSPKVKYDRLAGRWFIIAATDALPGRIVIASSNASTITPATVWSFFFFDNSYPAVTTCAVDSPSLGIDNAALYIGVNQFCDAGTTYGGTSGYVVRKTSVIDAAAIAVTGFHGLTGNFAGQGPFAPQGADNDDPASGVGYFIGVDNASLGTLVLRRISNPGVTPTISGNIIIPVAPTAAPIMVRHLGNTGGANGYLDGGDDRLTAAVVRNGTLWTSQTIGVLDNGTASASATRNGVRWYALGSLNGTPVVQQQGTLFAAGGPGSFLERNYWMPSIASATNGRTVVGFSAAGASEYANAGVVERLSADAVNTLRAPQLYTAANDAYNPPGDAGGTRGRRWGSASSTVLDGCDGTTIWTVQQFTDTVNSYGLQVARTVGVPPPATPVSVSPSAVGVGLPSVNLTVTATSSGGSAFLDPGAGWLCRLSASIPGVTVNSVTRTGPTTATVNISTVNATAGPKTVMMINPDGQAAATNSLFRVTVNVAPPVGFIDTPNNGVTARGELGITGWALDDGGLASVDIMRSPVAGEPPGSLIFLGRASFVRGARPDVAAAFPDMPDNDNAGWGFMVLTNMLPNQGNGTFDLHAVAVDLGGATTLLGTRRIVAANSTSAFPFGTIDTPGQGETVSGTIVNFGWALAPLGRQIPINGSTIDVYVDGVLRGHPVYNNVRADIASLFPGLYNTTGGRGAVGYFVIDTTTLTNGLHTINWVVRDDIGQASGIGSRYFRVQN
jgi:hypothetical protein